MCIRDRAVLSIDEFGALNGGRFEQAAVAQVARLAMGHREFAGHDLFVAYEAPGRIWIALAGGPIVRNGISLLRGLQQDINDRGSIPAHRLDVDVHVSISMGYAAHQVDDFTLAGLKSTAELRLLADANTRNPFMVDNLANYDIRPEDIIGEPEMPFTAVDVLQQLTSDMDSDEFPLQIRRVSHATTGIAEALLVETGWNRVIGNVQLSCPTDFAMLINRQAELAAVGTHIVIGRLLEVMDQLDKASASRLPILVPLPSVLLEPDAGHLALPNLISPRLDRSQCARTVALVDRIPLGSGQSLRVLADRGLNIAVTASAAANADPDDLAGWPRWAIVFPQSMVQGSVGIDALTIQQTVAAIGCHGTKLIGEADGYAAGRGFSRQGITWVVDPKTSSDHAAGALQDSPAADNEPIAAAAPGPGSG